jgi:putative peptidoglycan lipid II flippase
VIRASAGTWLSYLTTVVFQVLFARRFGAGSTAAAFVIVFSLMASASGLLVSTVQSVAVPRLVTRDGALAREPLRFLALISAVAVAVAVCVALVASPAAELVRRDLGLDAGVTTTLLRLTALVLPLQVLAGEAALVALALGHRMVPALAPAFPTLAAAVALAARPGADVATVYGWFAAGSVVQLAVVAGSLAAARARVAVASPAPRLVGVTALVVASYVLLAAVVPAERVLAGARSASDAATYDYAARSLRAVEQLMVSGLALASLGDWSTLVTHGGRDQLARTVLTRVALAGTVLALAAAVATVAGHELVRAVFEHGSFTGRDTDRVTGVLTLALPGFWAEGVGLVLVAALLGTRQAGALAVVGIVKFAVRIALLGALAPSLGAPGAAVAYSVASVAGVPILVLLAARHSLWSPGWFTKLRPAVLVATGTLLAAVTLAGVGSGLPEYLSAVAVVLVFAGLSGWLRPIPLRDILAPLPAGGLVRS